MSREIPIATPVDVLRSMSGNFSFSTFVHFRVLADICKEVGACPDQWQAVLAEWQYEPAQFLAQNKRGNCVDFAKYGQQALGSVGLQTGIIGSEPSSTYSQTQKAFMKYRHTSLVARDNDNPTMYEPGWKIPQAIPLLPIGAETDTGSWRFTTLSLDEDKLTQQTTSPSGYAWPRRFSLEPIAPGQASDITKGLLRVPRKIDMITRLDDNTPHYIIGYNPKTDSLTSNIPDLPDAFSVDDLTPAINERASEAFGYDVKEELVASLGLLRALPEEYWVR